MMMALAIMLGIILIACVGFFQLASVQQAELYEYAANMSSVLEPDNQTIQEVAAKYNLTTDVVEDIYDDLTSRSGAAALSKVMCGGVDADWNSGSDGDGDKERGCGEEGWGWGTGGDGGVAGPVDWTVAGWG